MATLSMSAQVTLPDWVRERGLALFTTAFSGAMTLGSAVWGELAAIVGLPLPARSRLPLTWRWKLLTGAGVDWTPSMHWPMPITVQEMAHDRGPVLVTVEYRIRPQDCEAFLEAIARLGDERRRDGAYDWAFSKTLQTRDVSSKHFWWNRGWHLRQHERVLTADRVGPGGSRPLPLAGALTHYIAVGS
jgi:hypothetical protein